VLLQRACENVCRIPCDEMLLEISQHLMHDCFDGGLNVNHVDPPEAVQHLQAAMHKPVGQLGLLCAACIVAQSRYACIATAGLVHHTRGANKTSAKTVRITRNVTKSQALSASVHKSCH
jgi:hypothetical protein